MNIKKLSLCLALLICANSVVDATDAPKTRTTANAREQAVKKATKIARSKKAASIRRAVNKSIKTKDAVKTKTGTNTRANMLDSQKKAINRFIKNAPEKKAAAGKDPAVQPIAAAAGTGNLVGAPNPATVTEQQKQNLGKQMAMGIKDIAAQARVAQVGTPNPVVSATPGQTAPVVSATPVSVPVSVVSQKPDANAAEKATAQLEQDKADAEEKAAEEARLKVIEDEKLANAAEAKDAEDKKAAEEARLKVIEDEKLAKDAEANAKKDGATQEEKDAAEKATAQLEQDKADAAAKAETAKKAAEEAKTAEETALNDYKLELVRLKKLNNNKNNRLKIKTTESKIKESEGRLAAMKAAAA